MDEIERNALFKKCSCCGFEWGTRKNFLSDPSIDVIGYQVHFENLREGTFLFMHHTCKSTLANHAGDFQDLYDGPIFAENALGKEECPNYCLVHDELRPCPVRCECAYVREVIQIVKNWPKQ